MTTVTKDEDPMGVAQAVGLTVAAMTARKPAKLNAKRQTLRCGYCGSTDLRYIEDISCERALQGINEAGRLIIHGYYQTDGWDDGGNARLYCGDCSESSDLPAGLDIEFV